jgi:hypothetical protein
VSIAGSEQVIAIFNRWPSFHDAEVVRLALERTASYERGPDLTLDLHAFEITSDVGPNGQYVLRHHVLISFRFSGVADLHIDGFDNQNAIMGLRIENIRDRQLEELRYEVQFGGSFGVSAAFLCRDASVERVRPWNEEAGTAAG